MCYCVRAVGITNVLIGLKKNKKNVHFQKILRQFSKQSFQQKMFLAQNILEHTDFFISIFCCQRIKIIRENFENWLGALKTLGTLEKFTRVT